MSFTEAAPVTGTVRAPAAPTREQRIARALALPPFLMSARSRTGITLQLSLCAIIAVFSVFVFFVPLAGDLSTFLIGVLMILGAGCAIVLVPWTRAPAWAMIAVPLIDVVAITIMRQSDPTAGFSLLYFLPVIWMSVYFGLVGYLLSIIVVPAVVIITTLLTPGQTVQYSLLSLVVTVILIATIGLFLSRRLTVQHVLFERQTRTMGRTLRRAQRQEELLAEVLDTVDFGVIRIAADGTTTITNEAHARLQRAARTADLASSENGAVFEADGVTPLPRAEIPFARAARGEVFDNQIVWFGSEGGGRRRALSVTARRTYAVDGTDSGAVIVSRDVTSELTALRARDSLVSSVSHELRTPLTSIIGYLELAVDDPGLPERARSNLEVAERNASRLLEIVSDILTASSRSQMSADMTISQQDIDIADLVRASGESWRPPAAERAIHIDLDGVRGATAYADPLRMRQVIDNLISNAVKYNRDGGTVTLRTFSDGLTTSVAVSDTGIGLTDSSLERLFERFFRADRENSTGTGLGLAISRELVRAHGGDIEVTSAAGQGTTFTVYLPTTAEGLDELMMHGTESSTTLGEGA
jgi:signal transduction histidine kinase